nr:MAG: putative RNA dependent RNA polymerase [Henan sediment noda-like virus 1]
MITINSLCYALLLTITESPGLFLVLLAIAIWLNADTKVTGYTAIGPYPVEEKSTLFRALQRALIDRTRVDVQTSWFPLNSKLRMKPRRISDNGHATSGAIRDTARQLITSAVSAIGRQIFEISPAKQSAPSRFDQQHYAVADLARPVSSETPKENDVIVGIDIDYYFRDPSHYLGYGLPVIFHTFNPIQVAGTDGDSHFRILSSNGQSVVHYDVSGGGAWKHQVWDWCAYGEFIEAVSQEALPWWARLLGIVNVVYHKVHHARPWEDCPDRALVWCLPQYTCWRFKWLKSDMHCRKLARINYQDKVNPGWNSLVYPDVNSKLMISLGRIGDDLSISLPKEHYDMLVGLSSSQSITSRMIGLKYTDPTALALFNQYFTGKVKPPVEFVRVARPIQPLVHWHPATEADEVETSSRVYGNPIVSDADMVPMLKRFETLSNSIDQRVTFVQNVKTPTPRIQNFAREFIDLIVPLEFRNKGVAYSLEETAELLDKPSQCLGVQQIWETVDMEPRALIEAFVKNEPCRKSGRIISSFADMRFLLKLSSFSLAFRDKVLHAPHNKHWFCPGLTPKEIALKVVEYCRSIGTPMEADMENFDGSVSEWAQRHVMNAVYYHYFNVAEHEDLRKLTDLLITCPARAKRFGFRYDAGVGVKSGSPTTCDLNTVLNGFLQYCSVRMTKPDLEPLDAFSQIGLAFGDDSLFDVTYKRKFSDVVENMGLKTKIETFDATKGVTFLARVFPDPDTTTTSFQDPLRTWRKMHITMRDPNVPLGSAACDRVEGYLVSDLLSPLTSQYCQAVLAYYSSRPDAEKYNVRHARKSSNREKPYWLTQGGSWPQDERDIDLMLQVTSARTGIPPERIRVMQEQLLSRNDPWSHETVDRELSETVYKTTNDADGGVAEGEVDTRKIEYGRRKMHARAIDGAQPEPGDAHPANDPKPKGNGGRGQQHPKGPGKLQPLPNGNRRQNEPRDKGPPRQTQDGGLSQGRKRRSQRSRPNPGTPGKAAQPRAANATQGKSTEEHCAGPSSVNGGRGSRTGKQQKR